MLSPKKYWGEKTLIRGDVNSGKTQLTLELLSQIIDQKKDEIAVLDLAPQKTRDVGGKMEVPAHSRISYYTTSIIPPRLTAKDIDEAEVYSLQNANAIEELFSTYLKNPKGVLVINDVSLYLQKGKLDQLLEVISPSHTVIMNGYYGRTLGDNTFSEREKEQMDRLAKMCDRVIHLGYVDP